MGRSWVGLLLGLGLCAAACSREINDGFGSASDGGPNSGTGNGLGGAEMDAAPDPFGNASPGILGDGGQVVLPADGVESFFINDPLPPYCGPDDSMQSGELTGTVMCPSDKNREGCACPEQDLVAPCWPGKRINREHGICHDGMTTCTLTEEFGLRWGRCEGYVLPNPDVIAGPEACRCFSSGRWNLTNLTPCIYSGSSGNTYLYSSQLDASGGILCGSNVPEPPPPLGTEWSQSTLNVDCEGQFELCYTIKAGTVSNRQPSDCTIMQACVDVWYPDAGLDMALPPLPSWSSSDTDCAAQFVSLGGYGEMSVIGESVECDVVDDGMGNPYVFRTTNYCKPSCGSTPDLAECKECQTGGSGMFQ